MDSTPSNHQLSSAEIAPSIDERLEALAELLVEVLLEEEIAGSAEE